MKESRIAFSSSFILPPSSFVCAPNRFALEAEAHLQLDAAVAGGLVDAAAAEAAEAAGARQRLAEERRAEVADGRAEVRVVQKVLHVDGESQVVAVLRRVAAAEALAAPAAATTATPSAASATAATTAASAAATTTARGSGAARAGHFAEADRFAQTHVDGEEGRAG